MKKDNANKNVGGGIGFCGLLGIAFIVLKLVGVISWPWIWVLSPLWIPAVIIFAIMIVAILKFT